MKQSNQSKLLTRLENEEFTSIRVEEKKRIDELLISTGKSEDYKQGFWTGYDVAREFSYKRIDWTFRDFNELGVDIRKTRTTLDEVDASSERISECVSELTRGIKRAINLLEVNDDKESARCVFR